MNRICKGGPREIGALSNSLSYRADLLNVIDTASNLAFVTYLWHRCLVVIRTWFTPSPFCYPQQVNFNRVDTFSFSNSDSTLTSLPCWGRVVIGSLFVYQTSGAGSNPVVSTTVLTVLARPIGTGQKSCIRYAWEGLERSRPFQILPAYRAVLLLYWHHEVCNLCD